MPIHRLSDKAAEAFAETPELAMGIQIGVLDGKLVLVLSGEIALEVSPAGAETFGVAMSMLLSARGAKDDFAKRCLDWRNGQEIADPTPVGGQTLGFLSQAQRASLFVLAMPTTPFVPPPPAAPPYIYGQLPFTGTTTAGESFLRFEPWPTSRRLKPSSGTVAAGTYAGPFSERRLVPNGFAAVGRYALPNLLPACTVWRITPPSGTRLAVGASVPLYGQAGGGAEVCFPSQITSVTISKLPSLPVL